MKAGFWAAGPPSRASMWLKAPLGCHLSHMNILSDLRVVLQHGLGRPSRRRLLSAPVAYVGARPAALSEAVREPPRTYPTVEAANPQS